MAFQVIDFAMEIPLVRLHLVQSCARGRVRGFFGVQAALLTAHRQLGDSMCQIGGNFLLQK